MPSSVNIEKGSISVNKFFLILVLSLCIPIFGTTQSLTNLRFTSLDNTNGLPSNAVNAITQDKNGFVWIGTNEGLCRYDSPNNISKFGKASLGLESSNIRSLYSDNDNNLLWIGTRYGGIVKLNLEDYSHTTYTNDPSDSLSLSNDEILCINKINETLLFVGTENGLNIIDLITEQIYPFTFQKNDHGLEAKAILNVFQDHEGHIWMGTWGGGLYHCHLDAGGDIAETKFVKIHLSDFAGSENVWKIFQDEQKRMWVGTHGGGIYISEYNEESDKNWDFIKIPYAIGSNNYLSSEYIHDIVEDRDKNIWIGSVHGLFTIDANSINQKDVKITEDNIDKFIIQAHTFQPEKIRTINNNNINQLYRCSQDLIWVANIGGLNTYNWTTNQFQLFSLPNSSLNKVDLINGIYPISEDEFLIGGEISGLNIYNTKTDKLEDFNVCGINQKDSKIISTIYSKDEEYLYIGTSTGMTRIHKKDLSCTQFPFPKDIYEKERSFFTSIIFKDSKNRIWMGTEKGLFVVDEKTKEFQYFINNPDNKNSITDNSITKILEDSNGDMWISTFNGINKLEESNGSISFINYSKTKGSHLNNILSNQVTCAQEYRNKIYFSSHSGLFTFDLSKQIFEIINEDYKQSVIGFEILKNGELWATTFDGVTKYDLNENSFVNYNSNDGLGSISYRINAHYKDENENIYFGGVNGFAKVVPTNVYKNIDKPNVAITQLKIVNSKKDTSLNLITEDHIKLSHDTYYLGFDFCALNYNQIKKNTYAYKLEGFVEDDWTYINEPEQIVYTNLDPGKYSFKVKAANNHGLWNEEGDTIDIEILPAFWQTLWFKLISILFSLLLLAAIVSWYTNNIKERNKILSEYNNKLNAEIDERKKAEIIILEREKKMKDLLNKLEETNVELERSNKDLEQFAYVASHDIKEPLRTIGTFVDLFSKNYHEEINEKGKEYLGFITDGVYRMSNLINSLLTYSRVGTISTSFIEADLNIILQEKLKDLKPLIEAKNVTINYNKLPTIICASDQISMVLYNLILNGIKFNKSEEKIIDINVNETDKKYVICVKDNGIGISKKYQSQIFEIFKRLHTKEEYEGTGIGLALCKKIVDRHHGKIWLESDPDKGSAFYFSISKSLKRTKIQDRKAS